MPYNSETETFYQAPATVVDSTPDGDTVQEGFDDRLTPAFKAMHDDLNLLKADGMISVGIPATTTARGIGRVATSADLVDGATINNGPAFLAAGSEAVTTTPTAHAVPQADEDGKLDGWVSLDGKANNDLSNLEPAAEEVIRSKTALRTLGTRGTTGSWTITDVEIDRPLMIFVVGYTNRLNTYVSLTPQSNLLPTGVLLLGARGSTEAYALGLSAIYVPSSDTVVISVTDMSSSLSLVAKQ